MSAEMIVREAIFLFVTIFFMGFSVGMGIGFLIATHQ